MPRNYRHYALPHLAPYSPCRSICESQHHPVIREESLHSLLNILLNIRRIQHTSTLRSSNDLRNELSMSDRLPALHNADDSSLRFVVAVRCNTLVSLLVLLLGFFGLDLVDLDAVFGVGEVEVHGEGVADVDVFAFGVFTQNSISGAGKGL